MHQRSYKNPEARPHRWLGPGFGWLALGLPLFVTLARVTPSSQWRDDLPIVRTLGFTPVGGEGVLSTLLVQLATLVPIGGRLLRATWPSAVACAVAALLIYRLTLALLAKNSPTPRLSPLLALLAAWGSTLCTSWQLEAVSIGGATVAAVLVLWSIEQRPVRGEGFATEWLALGALLSLAGLENRMSLLAMLCVLATGLVVHRALPTGRKLLGLGIGAAVVAALGLMPLVLRPLTGHAWVELGYGLFSADLGAHSGIRTPTWHAWLEELGPVFLAAALFGACWLSTRQCTRRASLPLLALLLLDWVLPTLKSPHVAADPRSVLRLLSVAVLFVLVAVALQTVVLALRYAHWSFARPMRAAILTFSFAVVLVIMEESAHATRLSSSEAAEAWTDEALGSLPPNSMVLVRSEAAAWRLWAARVSRGQRTDVVLAPIPLLDHGSLAARSIQLEPSLDALVRELRISGKPNEYALSTLADARPLFVEFDPAWDQRLLEYLLPHPFWMRFAPHAVGRSDRQAAFKRGRDAFDRVLESSLRPTEPDPVTLSVLAERAREQAVMLGALGDEKSAEKLLRELDQMPSQADVATSMEEMLQERTSTSQWLALLR